MAIESARAGVIGCHRKNEFLGSVAAVEVVKAAAAAAAIEAVCSDLAESAVLLLQDVLESRSEASKEQSSSKHERERNDVPTRP